MSLKQYISFMAIFTTVAWLVLVLVVFFINPREASTTVFGLFYLSLFAAFLGTLSLLGFFVRYRILKQQELVVRLVSSSFRQAILYSFLFTSALYLQSKAMLVWWNVVFLILALTLLEFFFITYRRPH